MSLSCSPRIRGCGTRYQQRAFAWREQAHPLAQRSPSAAAANASIYDTCWAAAPTAATAASSGPCSLLLEARAAESALSPAAVPSPSWTAAMRLYSEAALAPSLQDVCSALSLAQRLAGLSETSRLLLFMPGGAARSAAHGGVWGLGRVLRLEHAALHTQCTDVAHGPGVRAARALTAQAAGPRRAPAGAAGGRPAKQTH